MIYAEVLKWAVIVFAVIATAYLLYLKRKIRLRIKENHHELYLKLFAGKDDWKETFLWIDFESDDCKKLNDKLLERMVNQHYYLGMLLFILFISFLITGARLF
jgi:hypothetical protein